MPMPPVNNMARRPVVPVPPGPAMFRVKHSQAVRLKVGFSFFEAGGRINVAPLQSKYNLTKARGAW